MAVKAKKVTATVDGELVKQAAKALGTRGTSDTVTRALRATVRRDKEMKIVDLFGKIDFDPDYDYKAARKKR